MRKYTIAIIILLFPMICTGQVNTKGQFPYILEETEENIQYLVEITRENSANKGDDFFLEFQVYNESKSRNLSISGRYKMHVIPQGDSYCTKIRMYSKTICENGEVVGHGHPSGEWSKCGNTFREVLDYYFKHKSMVKTMPKK
ncbi:MAG: hypothetical protein LBV71_19530 [Prevotella sp.]|jgi:hypothetical protein|nr:hypothetical protein [Prevotella sp.]